MELGMPDDSLSVQEMFERIFSAGPAQRPDAPGGAR